MTNPEQYIKSLYPSINLVIFFGAKYSTQGQWDIEALLDGKSFSAVPKKGVAEALEALVKKIAKGEGR